MANADAWYQFTPIEQIMNSAGWLISLATFLRTTYSKQNFLIGKQDNNFKFTSRHCSCCSRRVLPLCIARLHSAGPPSVRRLGATVRDTSPGSTRRITPCPVAPWRRRTRLPSCWRAARATDRRPPSSAAPNHCSDQDPGGDGRSKHFSLLRDKYSRVATYRGTWRGKPPIGNIVSLIHVHDKWLPKAM